MAKLVFSKDFLDDYSKLDRPVQKLVRELPDKFSQAAHTGVHLEKPNRAKDERVRTVRVDIYWRGVVIHLGEAIYALLRVLGHDEAYDWAARQRFGINPVTGIVELVDVPTVEERVDALTPGPDEADANGDGLFADRRDRDFEALGVDAELVPVLRRLGSESELLAVANLLPHAQGDALLYLAEGLSVEDAWAQLAEAYEVAAGDQVDVDDLDAALDRPGSRSQFVPTAPDDPELDKLLSGTFEAWRTFLHPSQRSLAHKPTFNGPARVTGGAGTGKTVVAMHRARFLARQLLAADAAPQQRLLEPGTSGKVLVATYTNTLAGNLDELLRTFCTPEEYERLEVKTVDKLARSVLSASGSALAPCVDNDLRPLADEAAEEAGLHANGLDGAFLLAEWRQVVLARQIDSLAAYATTPRPGRGRRLPRDRRKAVWAGVMALEGKLAERQQASFQQIADMAAGLLATRTAAPYAHAVIDEAQDLHPAQWRLLRAAVDRGPNDLFLVGDPDQRIYDYRVNLASVGIETRGRSRRLRINYRTTQKILDWSLGVLTGDTVDDLDGTQEARAGYRSAFDGPEPQVAGFVTPTEEAEHVLAQVQEWLAQDVDEASIGVVSRVGTALGPIKEQFDRAGIPFADIKAGPRRAGVRVGVMHSAKGMEFQRVVVVQVGADRVPLPVAVKSAAEDPVEHESDMLRERCLLYVACTRARDMLVVTHTGTPSPFLPS